MIENKIKQFNSKIDQLEGQSQTLTKQKENSNNKIEDYKEDKLLYSKCVEFLTKVQESTQKSLKEGFESIVTYALRYIKSDDYKFELDFSRRGNLQQVDFNVITPECKQPEDPLITSGGGVLDIISLALRIAIMELSRPKIKGFLVLDESFKHLHPIPPEVYENARNFLEVINRKFNRQVIMVTGRPEFINNVDNVIKL